MATWQCVMTYERKLVRRNWLFRLFVLGAFSYLLAFLVPWDIHREMWWNVALASSIPVRAIYFLNLFQSLVVIFLVCDISRQRKKAESREVLSVKPVSNSQFFWAELAGLSLSFLVTDVIFMAFCLFINSIIPDSPVNLWVYLSFLLRGLLPTFIFVAGLSLFVNRMLRHPFLSWLVLSVFFFVSYAYLPRALHGVLDFRGSLLPESFSSIVGFAQADVCLLQRGMFLLLGVGLLCVAVPYAKRLPNRPGRGVVYHTAGCFLLVVAICTGYLYVDKFQTRRENRDAYRETFARYEGHPKARVSTHEITYTPEGDTFSATSRMTVVNRKTQALEQLILFLNPGLEIKKLSSGDQDIPFQRDHQAVVIAQPLAPGDSVTLEIEYGGYIDEEIYQVNLGDERYFAPARHPRLLEQYGKRSAFLSKDYTLLIPEVLWYPAAVAPVALHPLKETNFTNYTLRVKNPGEQVVLSQGIPEEGQAEVTYRNLQPLTGLSLCMGDYVKRSVVVDSITLEYYTYPGNDFYLNPLDGWMDEIAKKPDAEEYWKELVSDCRHRIEGSMPNPYPFKLLKIVEAPASFLYEYAFDNNVQPEMAFFVERMLDDEQKPDDPSSFDLEEMSVQENLIDDLPNFLKNIHVKRLFTDFHWSVASDKFAGIEMLFAKIATPLLDSRTLYPSALQEISEQGLEGFIREGLALEYPKVIDLKIYQLLGYLTTITDWKSLSAYIREFYESTRFREMDFDLFMEGFRDRFGQDIRPFVEEWYTTCEIPRLTIKDLNYYQSEETQAVDFKVGNFGNVDGTVSLIRAYSDDYGRRVIRNWRSFLVKPGEYKHIVAHDANRGHLFLSTNFSGCMPERRRFESNMPQQGALPAESVLPLEKHQFYPPGEIIVDNEDEGFRLIDSSGSRFKRLAERIAEEDMGEYSYYGSDFKKDTWGSPFIQDNVYGEEVYSAFAKVAGSGNCKAEWKTNLPEAGTYEIFVYCPEVGGGDVDYTYSSYHPGMKHYYTIYTPEDSEEIVWEMAEGETGWKSLGTFNLPAGESRIVLDDRGVPPMESVSTGRVSLGGGKVVQLVVADAVKWVKVK